MRNDIDERKGEILKWIKDDLPKSVMCRYLKCKPETLERRLRKWNIIYRGNPGFTRGQPSNQRKTALEYIQGSNIQSHKLKTKLIEDNIKAHQCKKCGKKLWMKVKIPLELHHIDGNRYNNSLDNLQLLCPNCHALEDNNSGKAIGTYKFKPR